MPKTTKLGIEITTDNETKFLDWREFINGDSPDSMANIIDGFAINITNLMNAIYGVSGEIIIPSGVMNYNQTINDLGSDDVIFLYPKNIADKDNLDTINPFVKVNGNYVMFEFKENTPSSITLNYFISRGK